MLLRFRTKYEGICAPLWENFMLKKTFFSENFISISDLS